jgi:hypothetical protein
LLRALLSQGLDVEFDVGHGVCVAEIELLVVHERVAHGNGGELCFFLRLGVYFLEQFVDVLGVVRERHYFCQVRDHYLNVLLILLIIHLFFEKYPMKYF